MNNVTLADMPTHDNQLRPLFEESPARERIRQHIADVNDKITEDDIRNIPIVLDTLYRQVAR